MASTTWQELLSLVRTQMADFGQDAWSDDELIHYFNYAQEQACRQGYLIRTSASTTLVADTKSYSFPTGGIAPIRLKRSGDNYNIEQRTFRYLDQRYGDWESTAGAPRIFVTDLASRIFWLYPYPDAADITANGATLNHIFAMEPATPLTHTLAYDGTTTPEIPGRYHVELTHYVRYMCYQKQGLERADIGNQAETALKLWENAMEMAKREMIQERGAFDSKVTVPRVW